MKELGSITEIIKGLKSKLNGIHVNKRGVDDWPVGKTNHRVTYNDMTDIASRENTGKTLTSLFDDNLT